MPEILYPEDATAHKSPTKTEADILALTVEALFLGPKSENREFF